MRVVFAVLLAATAAVAAEGFKARGFILPDGAVKIDDDRYRLPQPWDEAVKFYRRAYPPGKYTRRTLHSQTAVRAMHIENSEKGEWEGVNLYEPDAVKCACTSCRLRRRRRSRRRKASRLDSAGVLL